MSSADFGFIIQLVIGIVIVALLLRARKPNLSKKNAERGRVTKGRRHRRRLKRH